MNPLRRGLAFSFVLAEKYRVREPAARRRARPPPGAGAAQPPLPRAPAAPR